MNDDGRGATIGDDGWPSAASPEARVYRLDPHEPPSMGVVTAVAALVGQPPVALEPLYDVVDPEAVDALAAGGERSDRPRVTFRFEGCTVTVYGTDRIEVAE